MGMGSLRFYAILRANGRRPIGLSCRTVGSSDELERGAGNWMPRCSSTAETSSAAVCGRAIGTQAAGAR